MLSWKEQRQLEKYQKDTAKLERRQLLIQTMTPQELLKYDQEHFEYKNAKIEEKRNHKQLSKNRLSKAPFMCIDLAYNALMTPSEIKSLRLQMLISYSLSLKALKPCKLMIKQYNNDIYTMSAIEGFSNWDADISQNSLDEEIKGLRENGQDVPYIYLSGDAETEISSFDVSKIYIIGGLVDRNRHKNAALNRANELGIPSVKINLKQFAQLKSSQIIAVNHIFEMMTKLNENGDLKEAVLEVLPGRKVENAEVKQ
ncbi:tRNA (guanine9-N1)-methyltransferase [Spironucleus salmonicida]|uniref:tRNA (guanine(9)-N(1))-methyltransferase n=1 Tax=Spironucleus salmonicida TaxID=348837 RepID=V6LM40_9EUKA|nr:tRNA (guanine9-N1)-methyltransferase [Spironucleus salmonicida]|eukprot:EST41774.1 tRNA (Guanine-1)-methyltransferase family protein [Spironucleus salmonicida]